MTLAMKLLTYSGLLEQRLYLHVVSLEAELGMPDYSAASTCAHHYVAIALDLISDPHNRWVHAPWTVLSTVSYNNDEMQKFTCSGMEGPDVHHDTAHIVYKMIPQ
jgi:hypothetical protein